MKGLIWNCRGINKSGVSTFLRDLIQEYKFHFNVLQELLATYIHLSLILLSMKIVSVKA